MLLIILLAIDFTRKPENWRWFFSVGAEEQIVELKELTLDDLDFQVVDPEFGTLPQDTFVAVAEEAPVIDVNELGLDIRQIPQELLEDVQDKRVGLLRREQDAMDRVLKRVRALTQSELEDAAKNDVGFRVVFTDSEAYRGTLIRLDGTLWRLQKFPFGDPESTDDDLWQAWLFSSDSGNNPWVVFLTDIPADLEPGQAIDREVSLAGYFFKNYGYATSDGLHIAPMLIAKTMTLKPQPVVGPQQQEHLGWYVFMFLASVGLLFALLIWWFARSDRKFQQSRLAEIAEARHQMDAEFASHLAELPVPDPEKIPLNPTHHDKSTTR